MLFALSNLWIGATANAGGAGMSAPAVRQWARDEAPNGLLIAAEASNPGRFRASLSVKPARSAMGHPELGFADLP
ncbi:hypothetical protein ACS5PM_31900 [Ideonella sp. YS5]